MPAPRITSLCFMIVSLPLRPRSLVWTMRCSARVPGTIDLLEQALSMTGCAIRSPTLWSVCRYGISRGDACDPV